MSVTAPINLSLIFSEIEDRLILLVGPDQPGLLLTRRLTARLVNGFASVLETSSLQASTAPADVRDTIISMEHEGATTAQPGTARAAQSAPAPAGPVTAHLVGTVNIVVQSTHFVLTFSGGTITPLVLNLNRADLHRLIEVLTRQADVAGWNLPIDAAWLNGDTALLTIN